MEMKFKFIKKFTKNLISMEFIIKVIYDNF